MKKDSFIKRILRPLDVRRWRRKSRVVLCILLALAAVYTALYFVTPVRSDYMNEVSDTVREQLELDKERTRKRVTVAYNDLGCISYCSFEVTGANAVIERYVGFAGTVYKADEGFARTAGLLVNFTYRMLGVGEGPLVGIKLTMLLTFFSVFTGFVLAVFLALGKISKNKLLSGVCSGYIFFFRGTPLLIQLMCIYFGLPTMFGFAWKDIGAIFMQGTDAVYMGAFIAAYISFSLNSAAYCAEIVRAAILSIDRGQHEAAKALGMTYAQTMTKVVIPQSIGRLVPPVANEFIMVLKDASLVFAISLMDITTISKNIYTVYNTALAYIPALIIYLILTAVLSAMFNKLEEKFSSYL